MVHGRQHEKRGNGREVLGRITIAEYDELRPRIDRLVSFLAQLIESLLKAFGSVIRSVETLERDGG